MSTNTNIKPVGGNNSNNDKAWAAASKFTVSQSMLFAHWFSSITINAHERQAIAQLWEYGSMTMSELGSRIPLSRAAITALTDRLEALGYVRRQPDENDRRRTNLVLTEIPLDLVKHNMDRWSQEMEKVEAGFSAEERSAIIKFISEIRKVNESEVTRIQKLEKERKASIQ